MGNILTNSSYSRDNIGWIPTEVDSSYIIPTHGLNLLAKSLDGPCTSCVYLEVKPNWLRTNPLAEGLKVPKLLCTNFSTVNGNLKLYTLLGFRSKPCSFPPCSFSIESNIELNSPSFSSFSICFYGFKGRPNLSSVSNEADINCLVR